VPASKKVNLYDAKTSLSSLVDRAADGEEFIIAKAGKPLARLGPIPVARKKRKFGGGKGSVWIAPDFDAPLPDGVLAGFEGRR
jgi:prevent-host-death family protein